MKRSEHFRESARLLESAKKLSEEYIALDPEATKRKIDLEMLARQITDRAHTHALLATAPRDVASGLSDV